MEKILIVGTGALANLFGARLSASGLDVILMGTWQEGLQSLRKYGIRLKAADGEITYPVQVIESPSEAGRIEHALVLVKSWQTQRAAGQLSGCLAPQGVALSLQNGLGNRDILVQVLGQDRVARGVTTTGATLLGPGYVRPGGEGVISVGDHPRLDPMIESLRGAGFVVEQVSDVVSLIWRKLLINIAINPLTAILQVPNGELLQSASAHELMARAVREAEQVAEALGVDLGMDEPLKVAERVARKTASNRSSMLQDISRGAPTEIDAICGAVVRAGQEHGIPTPVNQSLLLLIHSMIELERSG